jgi:hypothetical protein
LLIRPFYINKKEYFTRIVENIEKNSPSKCGNLMVLDSKEFIQNKQEEFEASNTKQNQRSNKLRRPIKQNQIMNIKKVDHSKIIRQQSVIDKMIDDQSPSKSASLYNHSSPPKIRVKKT